MGSWEDMESNADSIPASSSEGRSRSLSGWVPARDITGSIWARSIILLRYARSVNIDRFSETDILRPDGSAMTPASRQFE